jgi:hypothetical protein
MSLGCSTLGHLLWECVGADVANWRIHFLRACWCWIWLILPVLLIGAGQRWSVINTGRPEWNI